MRSSSSRRSRSVCSMISGWSPRDIWLNDSARSPSWSCERIVDLVSKSPSRTLSVPTDRSCTPRVIERASISPSRRAIAYITRNTTPSMPSTSRIMSDIERHEPSISGASRRTLSIAGSRNTIGWNSSGPVSPVSQS